MPSAGPVLQEVLNAGRNPFQWPVRHAPTCLRISRGIYQAAPLKPTQRHYGRSSGGSAPIRTGCGRIQPRSGRPAVQEAHRFRRRVTVAQGVHNCVPPNKQKRPAPRVTPQDGPADRSCARYGETSGSRAGQSVTGGAFAVACGPAARLPWRPPGGRSGRHRRAGSGGSRPGSRCAHPSPGSGPESARIRAQVRRQRPCSARRRRVEQQFQLRAAHQTCSGSRSSAAAAARQASALIGRSPASRSAHARARRSAPLIVASVAASRYRGAPLGPRGHRPGHVLTGQGGQRFPVVDHRVLAGRTPPAAPGGIVGQGRFAGAARQVEGCPHGRSPSGQLRQQVQHHGGPAIEQQRIAGVGRRGQTHHARHHRRTARNTARWARRRP